MATGGTIRTVAFNRKLLNDNEDIVLDLNPHWSFVWRQATALVAAMVFGILTLTVELLDPQAVQFAAGIAILVALVWFGIRFAAWRTTNFVVTTDRLIYRNGVLSKHGIEIPLDRVNNVLFSQSIIERMLGTGDLVIESAGESGRQAFADVRKPSAVQNEIYRQIESNENRKFDRIGASGGASASSVADEIAKLDALRASGVLSAEEFAAQKAKLLGS